MNILYVCLCVCACWHVCVGKCVYVFVVFEFVQCVHVMALPRIYLVFPKGYEFTSVSCKLSWKEKRSGRRSDLLQKASFLAHG